MNERHLPAESIFTAIELLKHSHLRRLEAVSPRTAQLAVTAS